MNHSRTVILLTALLLCAGTTNKKQAYQVHLVFNSRTQVEQLRQAGFDVVAVNPGKGIDLGEIVVIADEAEIQALSARGETMRTQSPIAWEVDSGFKTAAQVEKILATAQREYPHLASRISIGKSLEGRDIWAIELTHRFVKPDEGKPAVLIDAMHHAREVMTPEIALDMVDYLTKRYETDANVKKWMHGARIWIVPMLNPDGNNRVWNSSSMWRKNTRGGYGVDINRNYPYDWNACNGSSGNKSNETYRGASAGSEPETQAIMSLARKIQPALGISYHSFSEIVIYPYGCQGKRVAGTDGAQIEAFGRELASKLVGDSGGRTYRAGTSYDLLYPTDGGSVDWMYAQFKTFAYCIEINGSNLGFQPSFSRWRDQTVERARAGWQAALDRVTSSAIHALASPAETVEVLSANGDLFQTKTTDAEGRAYFLVTPGKYWVRWPKRSAREKLLVVADGPVQEELR